MTLYSAIVGVAVALLVADRLGHVLAAWDRRRWVVRSAPPEWVTRWKWLRDN